MLFARALWMRFWIFSHIKIASDGGSIKRKKEGKKASQRRAKTIRKKPIGVGLNRPLELIELHRLGRTLPHTSV
jgi:hypothetical protein